MYNNSYNRYYKKKRFFRKQTEVHYPGLERSKILRRSVAAVSTIKINVGILTVNGLTSDGWRGETQLSIAWRR